MIIWGKLMASLRVIRDVSPSRVFSQTKILLNGFNCDEHLAGLHWHKAHLSVHRHRFTW